MNLRSLTPFLVVLGLALAPATAAADTLYATPSPSFGASCGVESPCSLTDALSAAVSGDTVVIGVGTYPDPDEMTYGDEGKSLTIAGAAIGLGRPVVEGAFALTGPTHIRDVEIRWSGFGEALNLSGGATANRVIATSTEWDGCSIHGNGGAAVTNSVCMSENPSSSSGLATQYEGPGAMTARNVTMLGYYGYYSNSANDPGLTMTDSIAMTTRRNVGTDAVFSYGITFAIRSYLFHQRFPENVSATESLAEAPEFRGPGDSRELAGSPSIDAGSTSAAPGELDLDGNLRKIGPRTDVGAYEFVPTPPSVSSPSTTAITTTSAAIGATVNPSSGRTYYHLEYGPSPTYGSSTPTVTLPAATTGSAVTVDLSGLPSGSTIHYSLVATSDGGTTRTPDASFATNSPAADSPSPSSSSSSTLSSSTPTAAAAAPAPVLSIARPKPLTLKVGKWKTVKVNVTNTGATGSGTGSLRVKAPKGVTVTPEKQQLPVLAPGKSWTVSVRVQLTRKAKKKSTLALTASASGITGTGSLVVKLKQ